MALIGQDLEAFADKVARVKAIREDAKLELIEGSKVGVQVLTELAADQDAPKHVRVKASELLVRFSGTSLEKTQVEISGSVEHTHSIEAAQVVATHLERLGGDTPPHMLAPPPSDVIDAEIVAE